jgi:soluble lytic murein transglycosylase-like protein
MIENVKLATQIAVFTGTMCLAASCTTAKVYSVVPEQKPSAEEIAMLATVQQTDTRALASVDTASLDLKPVDLATDKTTAMAYAIPMPKPASEATAAFAAVEVASADPAAAQELATPQVVSATMKTSIDPTQPDAVVQTAVMEDRFGTPDLTASAALVATTPKTRSIDAFATADKNSDLNQLISKYATMYEVPEPLVHHVVRRESNYNPTAVHRGNWGLMQIRYNTARGMGYDGSPSGLLDAETNLKYAVKYLRGAWIVAERDAKKADWLYRTGYYYQAKKKRLLDEIGMQ